MPEPFSAEQLHQLRQRWERDPKSRAFLQLAEEYRRAGRLDDAVHVLQAGLKEHPTYLSAQVALGRCLMESGAPDTAVEILERAVARDPTQLVANKLLVEAYLAKGQAEKASERLNLYKLFNDRDAEIEPLEARIRALQAHPAGAPAAKKNAGPAATSDNALFDLPVIPELPEVALEPVVAARQPTELPSSEPFGRVHPRDAAWRIESALVQQGIFPLAAPAPVARAAAFAPPAPHPPQEWTAAGRAESLADEMAALAAMNPPLAPAANVEWEPASWPEGAPPPEDDGAAPIDVTAEGDLPIVPFDWEPEAPEAAPEPPALPVTEAPKAASATLGELYLAQGHLAEAEESFQSVLRTRPGDAAALAGLESVRLLRGEEAAAFAEELPPAEESNVIVGGLTARKAALLKDYLARIRRGAQRRVS